MLLRGFLFISLFCASVLAANEPSLFTEAPEDWRPEVIPFPLGFAPEIDLEGVEELRFAPGMFKPETTDYFSYAFVWALNGEIRLSEDKLVEYLLAYYRGLYKAVSKLEEKKTENFKVEVTSAKKGFYPGAEASHQGTVFWREPFATEKEQTLHLLIDQWICKKTGKTMVYFLLSPQQQGHSVWKTLTSFRLKDCADL